MKVRLLGTSQAEVLADIDLKNTEILLMFQGMLNEALDLTAVLSYLEKLDANTQSICLDTGEVVSMNSMGVKSWVLFLQALSKKFAVRFRNVSDILLGQAMFMPALLGNDPIVIESYFAPYHCPSCKSFERKLLIVGKTALNGRERESFSCARCGHALDFDEVEEEFFSFLTRLSV